MHLNKKELELRAFNSILYPFLVLAANSSRQNLKAGHLTLSQRSQ